MSLAFHTNHRYRKVESTSPSCLEAHAGFFRLSMRGNLMLSLSIMTFWERVDVHINRAKDNPAIG